MAGINWDLLTEDELDLFQGCGVKMFPMGIEFARPLAWEEFIHIFACLFDLKSRTNRPDDPIDWALGDCINLGEQYFGEERVDQWLRDFEVLHFYRDKILKMAGGTLIYLQVIENRVKFCCAAMRVKGLNLTLDDFLSLDSSKRKSTLGRMNKALKDTNLFTTEFEDRLEHFVVMRNDFIHNLWAEQARRVGQAIPSKEEQKEIHDFIGELIKEAQYMDRVFRGLQYEITSTWASDVGVEPLFSTWDRYVPEFREVLRDIRSPKE